MSTHIYSFGDHLYLQCAGGPIGMRFTASLASVVMKQWYKAGIKLLKRENIEFDLFLRYVDDCRLFMKPLNPGWTWTGSRFEFIEAAKDEDELNKVGFVERTTREVTKAMCALTKFLVFTGEDCTMFSDCSLPTLDTTLWMEDRQVKYRFFEKPTVGNQVLNKDTALPTSSLRSSLLQETVRRLLNCSPELSKESKQKVLSSFGQKLINSGHSATSARIILVQGVVKYLWLVERSKLAVNDMGYKLCT